MDAIVMTNLSKTYSGKPVLDHISLTIKPGEVVGLLGRNGAGKTTMMRILYGLISPDSGSSEILGLKTTRDLIELRQKTAFVSEECHLYPWMTGSQLASFLAPMYSTWDTAVFESMVKTLEVPLEKQVKTMSKGTRRKLMLALGLAPKPQVLLLDEPLAGLDAVVREQILSTIIRTLSEHGSSILLSSHEILEIERVIDRTAILSQGRLLLDLGIDALKAGVRRLLITLECPAEILPAHASIISAKTRGAELDLVVKDYSEDLKRALLANLKVKEARVEGMSLQEIFVHLTTGREE